MAKRKARGRKAKNAKLIEKNDHIRLIFILIGAVLVLSFVILFGSTISQQPSAEKKIVKFTTPQVQQEVKEVAAPKAVEATPEKLPDLQVNLFSTYSGEIKQAVRITTDILNRGSADVKQDYKVTYGYEEKKSEYRTDYTEVGQAIVKAPHSALLTKPIIFLWVPEKVATYDFKICADMANEIKESNEENNCTRTTITIVEYNP